MEYALDKNNKRIHAFDADKAKEYFCPVCMGKVIPRQGECNSPHFAHAVKCLDTWHYDMSLWHSQWQMQFPVGNREVVIEYSGEKHRADVMACGYVLEFQHSSITAEEFDERNAFYRGFGKKVIWIFDFVDEYKEDKMECYSEWHKGDDNGGKYKWRYPKRFLQNYIPQENKDIIVFFQITDSDHEDKEEYYMERVTWAIEEDGFSNFKRFATSYYPANAFELLQWVKNRKL